MTQRANISTAPACLNTNDKAMWVTGWNDCLAAQAQAAVESVKSASGAILGVRVQDDTVIIKIRGGRRWGNQWARELCHKILTEHEPGGNPTPSTNGASMKVRDLVNILERVREVNESIDYAQRSLSHGGSEATMARKQENLREVEQQLEDLLNEDLPK